MEKNFGGRVIYATKNPDGRMDEDTVYWSAENPGKTFTAKELSEGLEILGDAQTVVYLPCDGSDCSFATGCPCGDK